MSGYVLKAPDQPVTFVMDWRKGYLAPGERVLRDLGWTIQPEAEGPADLIVASQAHDARRSWAAFEGGAPGRVYMITNRVRTSDDRDLCRAIVMRIALGARPH